MTARMDLMTALERVRACQPARDWLAAERLHNPGAKRSIDRWNACPEPGWLLWLAGKAGVDRRLLALAACDCARLVLHLVPAGEDRPRLAIEAAEAWTRGEATIEQVRAARDACWTYWRTAYAAHAGPAAAAAYAADAAAARAAAAAARAGMRARCCDAIRARIPWADVERGIYLAAGGVL